VIGHTFVIRPYTAFLQNAVIGTLRIQSDALGWYAVPRWGIRNPALMYQPSPGKMNSRASVC